MMLLLPELEPHVPQPVQNNPKLLPLCLYICKYLYDEPVKASIYILAYLHNADTH